MFSCVFPFFAMDILWQVFLEKFSRSKHAEMHSQPNRNGPWTGVAEYAVYSISSYLSSCRPRWLAFQRDQICVQIQPWRHTLMTLGTCHYKCIARGVFYSTKIRQNLMLKALHRNIKPQIISKTNYWTSCLLNRRTVLFAKHMQSIISYAWTPCFSKNNQFGYLTSKFWLKLRFLEKRLWLQPLWSLSYVKDHILLFPG